MNLSSIEIKNQIRKITSDFRNHSVSEIKNSIVGSFTSGQLSGALAYLVKSGDLLNIGRGIYKAAKSEDVHPASNNNKSSVIEETKQKTQSEIDRFCRTITKLAYDLPFFEMEKEDVLSFMELKELCRNLKIIRNKLK